MGIFLGDNGTMGIKTTATMKIYPLILVLMLRLEEVYLIILEVEVDVQSMENVVKIVLD
ncbi:hypothetical protein ES703_106488 [subsurface metagenome]